MRSIIITVIKVVFLCIASIILFFFCIAGVYSYHLNHLDDKHDLEASIDKLINSHIKSGKSYGMSIGIVKNGKTFLKSYGTISKTKLGKPDNATLFELASVSKLFTTATFQILCDRNIVNHQDKIDDILKDKLTLPASIKDVTLMQLATHTSGVSVPKFRSIQN